jgi:cytidine deaminase
MPMNTQFDSRVALAFSARPRAYAPCSKFPVGAAVECKSDAAFENQSLGFAIRAERVGVGAAVAGNERDFVAIGVTSHSDEPIGPCGACRQFLAEFNPDLTIISGTVRSDRKIDAFRVFFPAPLRNSKTC